MSKQLNERQREFARLLVLGHNQTEAYCSVYGPSAAAASTASRLAIKPQFVAHLAQLRAAADVTALLSREELMQRVLGVAQEDTTAPKDAIAGYALYAKLAGYNDKALPSVQVNVGLSFSNVIDALSAKRQGL